MSKNLLKYLNESPQADLKLMASQLSAAAKKFNFNLNRYSDDVDNFKDISNAMLDIEDAIEKIRKML